MSTALTTVHVSSKALLASVKPPKMVRYSHVIKKPVEWLWPQRIALGKLTFIVGEPGLGKGFLTIDLAARVSRGASWPGEPLSAAPAGTVIMLHAEDDQQDTVPARLEAAGANLDKIITFELEAEGEVSRIPRPFSLQDDLGALEAALAATPDCRLVILDPITAYLGSLDGNHNHEVRSLLKSLAELAKIYRVAIVAVAHLNKRRSVNAVDRVMGALTFVAAARTVWGIVRDLADPEQRLMLTLKSNVAKDNQGISFRLPKPEGAQVPHVEWGTRPVPLSFQSYSTEARFNLAEQTYRDTEAYITASLLEVLERGPKDREWLGLFVRGTDAQIHRAAERIGVIKERDGYHTYWMLPKDFPEWKLNRELEKMEGAHRRQSRKDAKRRKAKKAAQAAQPAMQPEINAIRTRLKNQVPEAQSSPPTASS